MPYLEGAVVVIDNASGGIRALVGGRDYAQSKFNRALAPANRQVVPHLSHLSTRSHSPRAIAGRSDQRRSDSSR